MQRKLACVAAHAAVLHTACCVLHTTEALQHVAAVADGCIELLQLQYDVCCVLCEYRTTVRWMGCMLDATATFIAAGLGLGPRH